MARAGTQGDFTDAANAQMGGQHAHAGQVDAAVLQQHIAAEGELFGFGNNPHPATADVNDVDIDRQLAAIIGFQRHGAFQRVQHRHDETIKLTPLQTQQGLRRVGHKRRTSLELNRLHAIEYKLNFDLVEQGNTDQPTGS